ncbi:MAG: hypothetical protein IT486_08215 [Gammaproteobacteria bacterium]|nr:hypothetical protein [Gammaproteobacteria bacterium]
MAGADLREEARRNQADITTGLAILEDSLVWLGQAEQAVAAPAVSQPAPAYPDDWDQALRSSGRKLGIPTSAVWDTANATGAVALLPRPSAAPGPWKATSVRS